MKMKLKVWAMICSTAVLLNAASAVMAQGNPFGKIAPTDTVREWGDLDAGGPANFINAALNFMTGLAAVWLLITIIWAGINIIRGARSPEDFYKNLQRVMWAIMGMALVAFAYIIASWVMTTLTGNNNLLDDPLSQFK